MGNSERERVRRAKRKVKWVKKGGRELPKWGVRVFILSLRREEGKSHLSWKMFKYRESKEGGRDLIITGEWRVCWREGENSFFVLFLFSNKTISSFWEVNIFNSVREGGIEDKKGVAQ